MRDPYNDSVRPRAPAEAQPVGVEQAARRVVSFLDHANLDTSALPTGMGSALRALREALAKHPASEELNPRKLRTS